MNRPGHEAREDNDIGRLGHGPRNGGLDVQVTSVIDLLREKRVVRK